MDTEKYKKRIQTLESERFELQEKIASNSEATQRIINEFNETQKEISTKITKIDGGIDELNELIKIEEGEPTVPEEV